MRFDQARLHPVVMWGRMYSFAETSSHRTSPRRVFCSNFPPTRKVILLWTSISGWRADPHQTGVPLRDSKPNTPTHRLQPDCRNLRDFLLHSSSPAPQVRRWPKLLLCRLND